MADLWHELKARELASADVDGIGHYLRINGHRCKAQLSRIIGVPVQIQRLAVSEALRWEVWERDDFRCQKCGTRRYLSIDHKYPKCRGGPATMDNLETLCRSCNSRKGTRI